MTMKGKRAVLVFIATTIGLLAFLSSFSYCKFEENEPAQTEDGATNDEVASADEAFDSSLTGEEVDGEPTIALSPFSSFLLSIKDIITPLVEPSTTKMELGRLYTEGAILIFKAIFPDQSEQIESLIRVTQLMDEEYVEVYETLKALRDQILAETDADKKQELKNQMAELVNRMQTLFDERINYSVSVFGLDDAQKNAVLQTNFHKEMKFLVELLLIAPFRKLL